VQAMPAALRKPRVRTQLVHIYTAKRKGNTRSAAVDAVGDTVPDQGTLEMSQHAECPQEQLVLVTAAEACHVAISKAFTMQLLNARHHELCLVIGKAKLVELNGALLIRPSGAQLFLDQVVVGHLLC
jgi:hypothetical protein